MQEKVQIDEDSFLEHLGLKDLKKWSYRSFINISTD
ncbi:hypothetical protein DFP76_10844 [Marinomonas aquiplantarum]|uniref:Uncharacterized protein n=1 Tax=Marinomonas aquiplantarum TaxID=491951 RepID=A0A366CXI8_9GAMM|nr:hypothetical protein DFP76_10844 [Marinomonas aquiplantarum]